MANDPSVRSVGRTFDLLELFDHRRPFLTLREVVEASGLPKTTVVRLLGNLQARGLVSLGNDGRYTLGAGMLRWVRMSAALWQVNDETRACMRRVVDSLGETVNLYVRQDAARMSIAQEEGTNTVRNVVEIGSPMPLWAGSSAKVLLAADPGLIDEVVQRNPGLDGAKLTASVAAAKEQGYAVSEGEREEGASAVSAPVFANDGRLVAALSVSGPTPRMTGDRLIEAIRVVTQAAAEISGFGLGSVEELL